MSNKNYMIIYLATLTILSLGIALYFFLQYRKQRHKLEAFVEHVPCTVSWVNSDLKYIEVNHKLSELVGVSVDDFKGQKIGFMDANPKYTQFVESIFKTSATTQSIELQAGPEDQRKDILCLAFKFNDGQEATIIGVDITDQKKNQKLIYDQERALAESERLSALGTMAATIGHEINNPLMVINLCLDAIQMELSQNPLDPARLTQNIEKARNTTERIAKIVKSLKTLARKAEDDPFQATAVDSILEDLMQLCQVRFKKKNLQFEIQNNFKNCFFDCRSTQITQALVILVNNAYDAICESAEPWVRLEFHESKDYVEFWVTDSGSGITKELAEKILQPFYTTKPPGQGTGLGLSTCVSLLEAHHGSLEIDFECPNTRFILTIPKKHSKKPQAA